MGGSETTHVELGQLSQKRWTPELCSLSLSTVLIEVVNYTSVKHFDITLNHLVRKGSQKSTTYPGKLRKIPDIFSFPS